MHKVLSRVSFFILSAFLFSACTLFRQPKGGLTVTTNVGSDVFIDAKNLGSTPLSKVPLEVKKYLLKIVPQDPAFAPTEMQIKMFAGFETTVEWQFGKTKDESSGFVFELENSSSRDSSELEIITSPDNVPVTIGSENQGFSPLVIDQLPPGEYQLGLQAPGYAPSVKTINLIKGKRLLVTARLARKPIEIASPSAAFAPMPTPTTTSSPSATPKPAAKTAPKPYVQVLDTPTGFLRIRSSPSATGDILGQLNVGDAVPYGGETSPENWFKIVFGATSSAWISGQYSKLVQ